jgi:biotin transport system substrate-specific component
MSGTIAIHPTLADLALPRRTLARDAILIGAGSVVMALLAQVEVPLPFTPVPLTLQTLGVMLAGLSLGSRRGALCLLAYLAEGSLGLPVFAGGAGTVAAFAGPSGGYLLAFPAAAFLAGLMVERLGSDRTVGGTLLAMIAGHSVIYLAGVAWLAVWLRVAGGRVPEESLLGLGVLPFLPGDAVKAAVAAALVPAVRRIASRSRR